MLLDEIKKYTCPKKRQTYMVLAIVAINECEAIKEWNNDLYVRMLLTMVYSKAVLELLYKVDPVINN